MRPGLKTTTIVCILLLFIFLLGFVDPDLGFTTDSTSSLHIAIQEHGVAMIQARVKLSAPPDVVFGVLTDYANWPTLFPPGVEVKVTKCPTESYSSAKDVDCGMDSGISLPLGLTRGVGRPP